MFSGAERRRIASSYYPERKTRGESWLDRVAANAIAEATRWFRTRAGRFRGISKRVNQIAQELEGMDEPGLRRQAEQIRLALKTKGFRLDLVARTFAIVREISEMKIGLRHYDVQVIGGWVLLNGMVAEMDTGEGKTLTAVLPACTAALAGIPVHIITVNDYLARRDAEWMGPIYSALGLSVGTVTQGMDLTDRQQAYRCDVTYCTNKEIVFDYLKDRLMLGERPGQLQMLLERLHSPAARLDRLRLRGLCFGIVDEADSILIDEARTPLIISDQTKNTYEKKIYQQALEAAEQLQSGTDYTSDRTKKNLELTETGKSRLEQMTKPFGGFWAGRHWREELIRQALVALHFFEKDRDYLVKDGKIQIIDEFTGRLMPDRSWERGLHQLIEAREKCELTHQNETLARISYQRFFRRYLHLAGMTGTAREVYRELWSVYRLQVVRVPSNKPSVRRAWPTKIYRKSQEKWNAIVERIADLHGQGRPILVGTRSVAASENLSEILSEHGLPHRVLNARQDREEAEIIGQAGQMGQITVATNMAGRGTDIKLGEQVCQSGGLHVIATEPHEARRIDRQLFGRCGRQGDPGSFELIACTEDEVLTAYLDTFAGWSLYRWLELNALFGHRMNGFIVTRAQRKVERRHYMARRDLLAFDESVESALAFTGRAE